MELRFSCLPTVSVRVLLYTLCLPEHAPNHTALKSANRIEAILVTFYTGGPKESSLTGLAFTGALKINWRVWSPVNPFASREIARVFVFLDLLCLSRFYATWDRHPLLFARAHERHTLT